MRVIFHTDNEVNGGPKWCVPLEHVNKTISGKRVFVDAVKDVEVGSHWVWVALSLTRMFLVGDKRRGTDTGDKPHEDEGKDGKGKGASPGTPGASETGKSRKDPILGPLEGRTSLISEIWSAGLGEDELLF